MKKFMKMFSLIGLSALSLTFTAFAADYAKNPQYKLPEIKASQAYQTLPDADSNLSAADILYAELVTIDGIMSAQIQSVPIYVAENSFIKADAAAQISQSDSPVTLMTDTGKSITIEPSAGLGIEIDVKSILNSSPQSDDIILTAEDSSDSVISSLYDASSNSSSESVKHQNSSASQNEDSKSISYISVSTIAPNDSILNADGLSNDIPAIGLSSSVENTNHADIVSASGKTSLIIICVGLILTAAGFLCTKLSKNRST